MEAARAAFTSNFAAAELSDKETLFFTVTQ
jgi:hypothetical protein